MLAVAPSPIESNATTVATPITIPRMVNTERILFARKARRAIFRFSENNIIAFLMVILRITYYVIRDA
jgi:hypothetical protein